MGHRFWRQLQAGQDVLAGEGGLHLIGVDEAGSDGFALHIQGADGGEMLADILENLPKLGRFGENACAFKRSDCLR